MRTILIGVCCSLGCMGDLGAPPNVPDAQLAAVVDPTRSDASAPDIVSFVLLVPDARSTASGAQDAQAVRVPDAGALDAKAATPDTMEVAKPVTPACAVPQVVGGQACMGLLCPTCTPDKGFTIPIPHARGGVPCLWACGDARASALITTVCSSNAATTGIIVNGKEYSGPVVCVPWDNDCDFYCPDVFP